MPPAAGPAYEDACCCKTRTKRRCRCAPREAKLALMQESLAVASRTEARKLKDLARVFAQPLSFSRRVLAQDQRPVEADELLRTETRGYPNGSGREPQIKAG